MKLPVFDAEMFGRALNTKNLLDYNLYLAFLNIAAYLYSLGNVARHGRSSAERKCEAARAGINLLVPVDPT